MTDLMIPAGISGFSGLARRHPAVKEFQYFRTVSVQPSSIPSAPSIPYAIALTKCCNERRSYGDGGGLSGFSFRLSRTNL